MLAESQHCLRICKLDVTSSCTEQSFSTPYNTQWCALKWYQLRTFQHHAVLPITTVTTSMAAEIMKNVKARPGAEYNFPIFSQLPKGMTVKMFSC